MFRRGMVKFRNLVNKVYPIILDGNLPTIRVAAQCWFSLTDHQLYVELDQYHVLLILPQVNRHLPDAAYTAKHQQWLKGGLTLFII